MGQKIAFSFYQILPVVVQKRVSKMTNLSRAPMEIVGFVSHEELGLPYLLRRPGHTQHCLYLAAQVAASRLRIFRCSSSLTLFPAGGQITLTCGGGRFCPPQMSRKLLNRFRRGKRHSTCHNEIFRNRLKNLDFVQKGGFGGPKTSKNRVIFERSPRFQNRTSLVRF